MAVNIQAKEQKLYMSNPNKIVKIEVTGMTNRRVTSHKHLREVKTNGYGSLKITQ